MHTGGHNAAYEAIVVGSGAGGAAAAYQLVQSGVRVLLLEKGLPLPRDGSTLDVERVVRRGEFLAREGWVDGQGNAVVPEEHFNVGGKTKWYGAALLRFAPTDFAADPDFNCRGWPIRHDDLLPYYDDAERLLGVRKIGIEPDLQRIVDRITHDGSPWQAEPLPMGLAADIGAYPREATHFDGFASPRGLKGEAEQSLLSHVVSDPRLTLISGAEVATLIGAADDSCRITGVRLTDGRTFAAPQVLLAAGALHSPRLLARYLRDTQLDQTLPMAAHVGRNLKLHLLTAMVAFSAGRKTDLIRKTAVLTHRAHPHSTVQPLGFDAELIATLMPGFLPRVLARAVSDRAYGFFLQTEDGSAPGNVVRENHGNQQTVRVMDYDRRRLPAAEREHRRFTHALQRSLLGAGMLAFTRRIGLSGTAHACGTLVCGNDPNDSVVDARGQVHGLRGLSVVDGSVLPRISRVNPSLTIYAWALRVGALVAQQCTSARTATALMSRS